MSKLNRREFLNSTAFAVAAPALMSFDIEKVGNEAPVSGQQDRQKDILLGIIINGDNPDQGLKKVQDLGFETCQLEVSQYTPEKAAAIKNAIKKYGIQPNALLCSGPGKMVWDFVQGPATIGIVPRATRKERMQRMNEGIKFAASAGIPAVHTHFGFIPEDLNNPVYVEFIVCLKELGANAKNAGVVIYCETGQETPTTLQRAIEDAGTGNIFVNYDTANMVLYGKANPLDGLKMLSKYVRSLHAKDGFYPTNPKELGREVPIPQGLVNFPAVIAYLKEIKFKGGIIIECEISGQNTDYIVQTRKYLEGLIASK